MPQKDKNIPQKILRLAGTPGNEEKTAPEKRISGLRRVIAVGAIALAGLGVANNMNNAYEAYEKSPSVTVLVEEGDSIWSIASKLTNGDPRNLVDFITRQYGTTIKPGLDMTVHIGDNPSEYGENLAQEQEQERQRLAQNQNQG